MVGGKTVVACRSAFFMVMDLVWYLAWNSFRIRIWVLVWFEFNVGR